MIKLENAKGKVITVPSGARKFYEGQGFHAISQTSKPAPEKKRKEADQFDELLKKPIGQWSKADLVSFAKANSIDLHGTKNIHEARTLVKDYIDEQNEANEADD